MIDRDRVENTEIYAERGVAERQVKRALKARRRAWGFKERLAEGRGSEIARKCWEEIRGRAQRGKGASDWEKDREDFFRERGMERKEMEDGGMAEEHLGFLEKRAREAQKKERKTIGESRYNKWYGKVKREEIPGYLKKGWGEGRWMRVARLGKEGRYWGEREERLCRMYRGGGETWEHVWEECEGWEREGKWQEMVETILGEEGEGKLDKKAGGIQKEGRGSERGSGKGERRRGERGEGERGGRREERGREERKRERRG